jgi:predicted transglutaminase-like cysteine proteinase
MTLGMQALPPVPYLDFCTRRPLRCGDDAQQVLAGAARARAERAELMGEGPLPEAGPLRAVEPAAEVRPLTRTPRLWAKLVKVNARVNRALRPSSDVAAHGVVDFWTTPLEEGRHVGDCEDYVLEKIRTLVAEGVPRHALNIAIATTPAGESHTVLVVSTRSGDFVLDNLSPAVVRWDAVSYRWRQRQVGGQPFTWVMVKQVNVGSGG